MLVLSRKKNERIVIANNIVLTVIDVRGDKVRLGIDAPKDIPVHRWEVLEAIKRKAERPATGCPRDTDGDGNCPLHPNGCPCTASVDDAPKTAPENIS